MKKHLTLGTLVLLIATMLSVTGWYMAYQNNYILTYNDAASHLNISRRVVDSLTPGLAQIGTVWLPLPHLLMIPFAWHDYLWHTGFAGSIVSMLSYIIGVYVMYKLLVLLTENKTGAFIGTLVLALNPNLLYMQATPMTEPLLITTIIIAIYYVAKYLKENAILDLILCSIFVAAATLIRYDGWFLYVCLAILIPLWIMYTRGLKRAESTFFLYIIAGGFGIFLWIMWNLTIFGDALYFITGPYSAAAQQKVLQEVGQLPTAGSVYNASYYFMWAIVENNGMIVAIAAAIGLLWLPFAKMHKSSFVVVLAVLSPILFNIIALYIGQSALNVPQAQNNPGLFNIRYGMMAIPAIAIILGVLAANKYLRLIVILVLIGQSVLFFRQGNPITLTDGVNGLKNTYYTVEASSWLAEHYEGGLILTSLASHDAFVARTQLPMKYYIHEGTREYWTDALNYPNEDVQYIALLSFPPDSVYRALKNNPSFTGNYQKVHNYEYFEIYKRKD